MKCAKIMRLHRL